MRLVCGFGDRSIRLFDFNSGALLNVLRGHRSAVYSVAFCPDGTQIASASNDRTVRIWDADSGEQLKVFEGHVDAVNVVVFSPSGTQIVSGSKGGDIFVWDAVNGDLITKLEGHTGSISSIVFESDSYIFSSAGAKNPKSEDYIIRFWNSTTCELIGTFIGHCAHVTSLCVTQCGRLISASTDGNIGFWDIESRTLLHMLCAGKDSISCLCPDPNSNKFVAGSYDGTISVWDALTASRVRSFNGSCGIIQSIVVSPDGASIASSAYDGTVSIRDAVTGKVSKVLTQQLQTVPCMAIFANQLILM